MTLDADACWRAFHAHDARFDGRFFVGVATTRIYCRPVCRVRAPRRENCRFFASAAAAEAKGFRPCLRCRPELAPGHAGIDAGSRLAAAAVDLIEGGSLDDGGVATLARRIGVSRIIDATRASVCSPNGITPGATEFTVISGANALARARVSITTPALDAQ